MKTRTAASLLTSLLLIAGCATAPMAPEKLAAADYGPPPPSNYEEIIKARFSSTLIDPTSPLYEIGQPRKGYTQRDSAFGTGESFGWVVCGTVNSKNRMGGYTGWAPFFTLFRGDHLAEFVTGEASRNSVVNDIISRSCARAAFER